jgi:hypothetical protein
MHGRQVSALWRQLLWELQTRKCASWAKPFARFFPNPLFACIVSRLLLVRDEHANGLSFSVGRLPAKRMVWTPKKEPHNVLDMGQPNGGYPDPTPSRIQRFCNL